MAEPDDLLSKADALMARHYPERALAAPYGQIPVLEEVVDHKPGQDDLPVLTDDVLPASLGEEQAEALEDSIRAALLAELEPRLDALIEEYLKDGLAPLVNRIAYDLRGDLQLIARKVLGDVIRSAVERELGRRE